MEQETAQTLQHLRDRNLSEENNFGKNRKVSQPCPPSMRQDLKVAFDSVDRDRSGSISSVEIHTLFRNFQIDIDLEETEELLNNLDQDGNGLIDFDEFVDIMMSAMEDEDEIIQNTFMEFDVNSDGFIDVTELRYVLQYLGETDVSERDLKQMIKNADFDGDGKVGFKDFERLWKGEKKS